jgi:glutaredoxin
MNRTIQQSFAGFFLVAALLANTASAQNMFRWVDKDGKVHFSDQPPPPSEKNVTQKKLQGNVIEVDKLPFATREALRKNPVVIYTSGNCGDACKDGRNLLTTRGIPFTEKIIDNDVNLIAELKKLSNDTILPLLIVGQDQVKGMQVQKWNNALDSAGYPRINGNLADVKPTVIGKVDDGKPDSKVDNKADEKADTKSNAKSLADR